MSKAAKFTHSQFFALCEAMRDNIEGVKACRSRPEVHRLMVEKMGTKVPFSSIEVALEATGIKIERSPKAKGLEKAHQRNKTIIRAIKTLYDSLGILPPDAFTDLLKSYE